MSSWMHAVREPVRARAVRGREQRIPNFAVGLEIRFQYWDQAGARGNTFLFQDQEGEERWAIASPPRSLVLHPVSGSVPPAAPGTSGS